MARLKHSDLAAFSQALAALGADLVADTLSDRILACLRGLFDCDFASFSLLDLRRMRFHAVNLAPLVPDWPGTEAHRRHLPSDPAAAHIMRTRHPGALKISDFVSLREYRSLSVYTEVFGRVGCDRRLGFAIQNGGSPVSLVATLNRKGRDFSDEDRTLLDLLRPHLLQANAHANAEKQLRAEHARTLTQVGDALGAGMGEIGPAGRFLWLTPRGETLLKTFFPGPSVHGAAKRLPAGLEKRLAAVLRRPLSASKHDPVKLPRLVWRFPGPNARVLQVRLIAKPRAAGWQMLLEEIATAAPVRLLAQALKLTSREAEVLHWLRQGKTNWEIGTILGIAEKTVGKHLENIFLKLNVENRTAAVRVATEAALAFDGVPFRSIEQAAPPEPTL